MMDDDLTEFCDNLYEAAYDLHSYTGTARYTGIISDTHTRRLAGLSARLYSLIYDIQEEATREASDD